MLRSIVSVRPTFAAIFKYDLRMAFQPMPLSRRELPFDHPEWIFRTEVRRVPLIRRHPKWAICCTRRTTRAWTAAVAVRGRLPL
jgi:hypothetical protein